MRCSCSVCVSEVVVGVRYRDNSAFRRILVYVVEEDTGFKSWYDNGTIRPSGWRRLILRCRRRRTGPGV